MTAHVVNDEEDTLHIRVDRERSDTVEVPGTFEATDDFTIVITTADNAAHVHLNCDDTLAAGLKLETGNHFVSDNMVYRIPVEVDNDRRPFHGKFRVSVAYGSESHYVEIRAPEREQDRTVTVDENLAKPPTSRQVQEPAREGRFDRETILLALLGTAAIIVLVGAVILGTVFSPIAAVIVLILASVAAVAIYAVLDYER